MRKCFLIIALLFGITACGSSGQVPNEVCEIGAIVCDISETILVNFPELPVEVRQYLKIACLNLELLCETAPGTTEHAAAVESLKQVNVKLIKFVRKYKQEIKNNEY